MRTKITLLAIAIVAMFNTSCKKEDVIEPITPIVIVAPTTFTVNYTTVKGFVVTGKDNLGNLVKVTEGNIVIEKGKDITLDILPLAKNLYKKPIVKVNDVIVNANDTETKLVKLANVSADTKITIEYELFDEAKPFVNVIWKEYSVLIDGHTQPIYTAVESYYEFNDDGQYKSFYDDGDVNNPNNWSHGKDMVWELGQIDKPSDAIVRPYPDGTIYDKRKIVKVTDNELVIYEPSPGQGLAGGTRVYHKSK